MYHSHVVHKFHRVRQCFPWQCLPWREYDQTPQYEVIVISFTHSKAEDIPINCNGIKDQEAGTLHTYNPLFSKLSSTGNRSTGIHLLYITMKARPTAATYNLAVDLDFHPDTRELSQDPVRWAGRCAVLTPARIKIFSFQNAWWVLLFCVQFLSIFLLLMYFLHAFPKLSEEIATHSLTYVAPIR